MDWLGAKIKNLTGQGEVSAAALPGETGVRVQDVPPASRAAQAGLRANDVILKCNGKPADSLDLFLAAWRTSAGGRAKLEVWREQKNVTVELDVEKD